MPHPVLCHSVTDISDGVNPVFKNYTTKRSEV